MKQKKLVSAIKRTLGAEILISAAFVTGAYAQTAPTAGAAAPTGASAPIAASAASSGNVTQLQKVQVTGSLLRTSDKVGFNQVQTITTKEIQDSGAVTVADFLRTTSANSASSWNEATEPSFAPGGSGIALRGLSEKYTLVLIDGVRVAPYAFAVNATDTFFDLNTIPLNMVDHIEIVKTGAVSQYGSDAIAGVVNIITKKNFQGLTLDGSLGGATSGGQGTDKFGVTGGFGNLASDKFNVTIGASYFHQGGYTNAQRSNTSSQNYLNQPDGSIISPVNYWEQPGTAGTGAGIPFSTPCAPGQTAVTAAQSSSGNNGCAVNSANAISGAPEEERANVKIHATFQLTDSIQAYADIWESRNTTTEMEGYSGIGDGTNAYDPATTGVTTVNNAIDPNNPYNPNPGSLTPINYTFTGQPLTVKTTSNFFRAATGVKGTLPVLGQDWDWSGEVSHSQSIVDDYQSGMISIAGLQNILGPNGTFNFANPSSTPNGLAGLYTTDHNEAISMLDTVDVTLANGSLFSLPAGDVGLGLGAEFTHQSEYIGNYSGPAAGTALPLSIQNVNGGRNVAAVYYQLDVPILTGLSFSQSGRYDHYSDFGGAFSPRFALRWQPFQQLTTYVSYSRGFRAPTLIENSQSASYGVQDLYDPNSPNPSLRDPSNTVPTLEKTVGNPKLQPERTRNYNVGFELSPDKNTDFGMDWYKIDIQNVIGSGNAQDTVNANDPTTVVRNSAGVIDYVDTGYQNLGDLETDGFEGTFRRSLPTSYGVFTLSGDIAYVWHFKVEDAGSTENCAGNNQCILQPFGAAFPRWKGTVDLAWAYRKFNTELEYQYSGPYTESLYAPTSVASMSIFNLNVSYSGFKNWTLYGGINNIFNKLPPYDALWPSYAAVPYDTSLYSNDGRFIQVGATYHF